MSAWRFARFLALGLTVVVLVVSATYLLLYLYRWEWNRAVMSGIFFLAALVILGTSLLLRSLARLGDRIAALERQGRTAGQGAAPGARAAELDAVLGRANADAARRRFAWLERPPEGPAVFVPVLLGTGVLLSIVAYVLERVAGAVAGGTLDRRTAALLDPDLPLGAGPLVQPAGGVETPARTRAGRVLGWGVVAALLVVLGAGAVDAIADATMSRGDPVEPAGSTVLVVHVDQRRDVRPVTEIGESLWTACRNRLPDEVGLAALTPIGDDEVRIEMDRALGPLGRRRFFGCLEDLTLDLVRADVRSWRTTPAPGAA